MQASNPSPPTTYPCTATYKIADLHHYGDEVDSTVELVLHQDPQTLHHLGEGEGEKERKERGREEGRKGERKGGRERGKERKGHHNIGGWLAGWLAPSLPPTSQVVLSWLPERGRSGS